MKRSVYLFLITAILSGCIVTKTPNTNDVTIPLGAQVTFSVVVFPPTATFAWTLDGASLSNAGRSCVYTAQGGEHVLTVKATHILGKDTQTYYILTNITFNKIYGGSGVKWANAVQQTSDGGYILAGGTSSFGAGSGDAWLIKTDANGNKVWDKTFGGSSGDEAISVQQTSDGGYILAGATWSLGAGNGDAWLIKTDANGNEVWDMTFGGIHNDWAFAVQQTSDGGYILAGFTDSFGAGGCTWLIKTDTNGNKAWDKTFRGSNYECAHAVQQTSDGGYILAESTWPLEARGRDAWLFKTDADGNKVWDKNFGGSNDDCAHALQQTSDGWYILAGTTLGDALLIKTDANGNAPATPTP